MVKIAQGLMLIVCAAWFGSAIVDVMAAPARPMPPPDGFVVVHPVTKKPIKNQPTHVVRQTAGNPCSACFEMMCVMGGQDQVRGHTARLYEVHGEGEADIRKYARYFAVNVWFPRDLMRDAEQSGLPTAAFIRGGPQWKGVKGDIYHMTLLLHVDRGHVCQIDPVWGKPVWCSRRDFDELYLAKTSPWGFIAP